jgi:hypothetical protein
MKRDDPFHWFGAKPPSFAHLRAQPGGVSECLQGLRLRLCLGGVVVSAKSTTCSSLRFMHDAQIHYHSI